MPPQTPPITLSVGCRYNMRLVFIVVFLAPFDCEVVFASIHSGNTLDVCSVVVFVVSPLIVSPSSRVGALSVIALVIAVSLYVRAVVNQYALSRRRFRIYGHFCDKLLTCRYNQQT
jgi:hypothetical protein